MKTSYWIRFGGTCVVSIARICHIIEPSLVVARSESFRRLAFHAGHSAFSRLSGSLRNSRPPTERPENAPPGQSFSQDVEPITSQPLTKKGLYRLLLSLDLLHPIIYYTARAVRRPFTPHTKGATTYEATKMLTMLSRRSILLFPFVACQDILRNSVTFFC